MTSSRQCERGGEGSFGCVGGEGRNQMRARRIGERNQTASEPNGRNCRREVRTGGDIEVSRGDEQARTTVEGASGLGHGLAIVHALLCHLIGVEIRFL